MEKTRIMLVDDHEVVRNGLRSLLANYKNLEVVAEAANGFEALERAGTFQPDIAIVDLQLPGLNGFEVIRRICTTLPKTKVIVFSFHCNESNVLSAFHAGAVSYVLKDSPVEEILHAIDEVQRGHRYLGSPLPELAIDAYLSIKKNTASRDPFETLTSREKEILQLIAEGLTNNQIAERLFISRRTVEIHRSNMMRKLGLHKPQVDLVHYAMERGLIKELFPQSTEQKKV